jgi:hypothetical protein
MRRIAITGHRGLSRDTTTLIDGAIRAALADDSPDITGISCLADGADQIFARAVIDAGGKLIAVIPAARYRNGLPPDVIPEYDRLLSQASDVRNLPYTESDSESHMAASELMIHEADQLYAVWDGQPARGYGGTADVVRYAREYGIPVLIIWPDGARRDLAPRGLPTDRGKNSPLHNPETARLGDVTAAALALLSGGTRAAIADRALTLI